MAATRTHLRASRCAAPIKPERLTALLAGRRVLTVPGIDNSGPDHWQTAWERTLPDCQRVELGTWSRPHRNTWVNALNRAIDGAVAATGKPVVLAAHSLGCLAVAWWAGLEGARIAEAGGLVSGALLVAPPEVDFFPRDERLSGFAPCPAAPLPFPARVVASRNDPYISWPTVERLARCWASDLVDIGACGHINAESELGAWPEGQGLLAALLATTSRQDDGAGSSDRPATDGALRRAHGRGVPSGPSATPSIRH